jgi:murein DD-endopeptidase MepM/ murein hydrolase activator NlpD
MRFLPSVAVPSNSVALTGKLGLLALLAALGACSNFDSLRSPVFTGSTNQAAIINGQSDASMSPLGNTYVGPQSAGIQGGDLPPPPGAPPQQAYASAPQGYAAPQAYTPPQGYTANGDPMPVGQFASAEPPPVRRGAPPTTLGEQAARIDGPRGGSGTHLVQPGDTAWNISQRYGVSVDALVAANGGSQTVRVGQRIAIPGGGAAAPQGVQLASLNPQAIPPTADAAPMPEVPVAASAPTTPPPVEQQVAVAPQTGNVGGLAPLAPQPAAAASSAFRWPVRGRIISGFGKKPNGERNDGINLAVPEGTSVKAAEDGTVIYAGNELKSYGNLVLIRHANGWVSAYAHNSALQVKRGDEVRRGQEIALSGMSGGVTTPQVHFELRKEATPVDPLQHLTES